MRKLSMMATLLGLACASSAPPVDLVPEPEVSPVRVAPPDSVVSCTEWVGRALANPDIDVTRVAEPKAYEPPPIPRRVPAGSYDKTGKAQVSITVVVDTLGKADMTTFTVVKSTSPRLTTSVRTAVAKWVFTPAEVMGCKVPRRYTWGATATRPKRAGS